MTEIATASKTRTRQAKVVGLKIALDLDGATKAILDGQSKIASWLWNALLGPPGDHLLAYLAAHGSRGSLK